MTSCHLVTKKKGMIILIYSWTYGIPISCREKWHEAINLSSAPGDKRSFSS